MSISDPHATVLGDHSGFVSSYFTIADQQVSGFMGQPLVEGFVVTSGTGSGKNLGYYMPKVADLGCILNQLGDVLGRHEQRLGGSLGRSLTVNPPLGFRAKALGRAPANRKRVTVSEDRRSEGAGTMWEGHHAKAGR